MLSRNSISGTPLAALTVILAEPVYDDGPAFDCCAFQLDAFQTCEDTDWEPIVPADDVWTVIAQPELAWACTSPAAATWTQRGPC